MDDKALLELCVGITGTFENGAPTYSAVTGNFDGMGLSCGVLQWCAGQGSLQTLVQKIGSSMGWDKAQTFFRSDIHHFSVLRPAEAIQWCLDHYIQEGSTNVDPGAKLCWQNFLNQPESIAAQVDLATNTVLARAKVLNAKFCPDYIGRTRTMAFFFDLVTQSGGMENKSGHVDPLPSGASPDVGEALAFIRIKHPNIADMWQPITDSDPLARLLLYYAYKRSLLSNPLYIWDALSRRGAIGCRKGVVHNTLADFSTKLD